MYILFLFTTGSVRLIYSALFYFKGCPIYPNPNLVLYFVKQKPLCFLEQSHSLLGFCLLTTFKFARAVPTPCKSSYISCHPFLGIPFVFYLTKSL